MGNKIKKIISSSGILALIIVVTFCFASCGNGGTAETEPSIDNTTTVATIEDIAFVNKEITVKVGDTSQLLATGIDHSGDFEVKWSSSNTSVAKVENGVITGIGVGTTTVTVLCGNRYDTCIVRVIEDAIPTQTINEKDYDLASRYLTDEVYNWSIQDIQTSINLILARNHYKFKKQEWLDYFSQFIWYYYDTTDSKVAESRFNKIELANYNTLVKARTALNNQNYVPDYSYDEKHYDYAMYYVQDIYDMSYWTEGDIQLAINTILARNHYKFKDSEWLDYFEQFSWYYYNTSNMSTATKRFNEVEYANYHYLAKLRD